MSSSLDNIPILSMPSEADGHWVLLHQVRHALVRFIEQDETCSIDLTTLPLSLQEQTALLEQLGRGEVSISLEIPDTSSVYETAYPGVWVVTHHYSNVDCKQIEICAIPDIVRAHLNDVRAGLVRLNDLLSTDA